MKRQVLVFLSCALLLASTAVDAQLGGLIKKKAGEVMTKKPETAKPVPPPAPAPTDSAAPATPPPASATPTPAAAPTPTPAAAAAPKAAVSPLDPSALPLKNAATQVLRDRIGTRENGDWEQLPSIPPAATAAAYSLNDAARAALVDTVGAALKTLVMSAAYLAEHDAFIKNEHHGVDHGLKGVVSMEGAMKKGDFKQIEAMQVRMTVTMTVDQVKQMPPDALKADLMENLPKWKRRAADPKESARVKYQKMATKGESIQALAPTDEKFVRGYSVIKSIDSDGPDTEDAVYAMHDKYTLEQEQAAYDEHSLKGQLKQQLTKFVAIAATVKFNAPTVEKGKQTKFVNAADEKQGAMWKACFRAGQPATAAAVKLAKAWLTEL